MYKIWNLCTIPPGFARKGETCDHTYIDFTAAFNQVINIYEPRHMISNSVAFWQV